MGDMTEENDEQYSQDYINVKEIFDILLDARIFIIKITAFFSICSITTALVLTDYYKSESVLVLTDGSATVGALGGLGGLAAMAGVTLPMGGGEDKGLKVMETIKSRAFVKHLLKFDDILPSLIAADDYDKKTKKLSYDRSIYDQENKKWVRKAEGGKGVIPSYLEAHEIYLEDILSISQDKISGKIIITIEHISPVFAKEFLDLVIREANSLVRQKDLLDSKNALSYLSEQINKTPQVEIRESINQLIQVQLETQMMANINTNYVLTPIEPPFIPEEKSKPNRTLIVIIGTLIGGILSVIYILARKFLYID